MKGGLWPAGFTIVEVMIFLAVSLVLLASALGLISGQEERTEFTQAVNDFNSKIQSVINETQSGFYPSTANFTCHLTGPSPRTPNFTGASGAQGTNKECAFIGKVLGFTNNNPGVFYVYTVAGARQQTVGGVDEEVQCLSSLTPGCTAPAMPTVVTPLTETDGMENGLYVTKVVEEPSGTQIGQFGFFTTFGAYNSATNDLISGAQTINLIRVDGTAPLPSGDNHSKIDSAYIVDGNANPSGGIVICLTTGGNNENAAVVVGSGGQPASTEVLMGLGPVNTRYGAGTCP